MKKLLLVSACLLAFSGQGHARNITECGGPPYGSKSYDAYVRAAQGGSIPQANPGQMIEHICIAQAIPGPFRNDLQALGITDYQDKDPVDVAFEVMFVYADVGEQMRGEKPIKNQAVFNYIKRQVDRIYACKQDLNAC